MHFLACLLSDNIEDSGPKKIGAKRIPGDIDCHHFKATVTKIIEQKVSDSIKQHIPFTTYGYRN